MIQDYGPDQWFVDFLRMEKMIDNKNIKKGAPKHNPVCYEVLQDIVIPAGTILRSLGEGKFGCGADYGRFVVEKCDATNHIHLFKKVIA